MKNKAVAFWLAVMLLFAGSMLFWVAARGFRRDRAGASTVAALGAIDQPPITDFTLTERSGKSFDSKSLKGQAWVASFFFASCPNVCRLQNMKVAELQQEFGDRGVRFVSITVDPTNDTPNVLSGYADMFKADPDQWLFLTGDLPYIKRIGNDIFKVSVEKAVHSDRLIVIDPDGRIRGRFRSTQPDEFATLKKLLVQLIQEAPRPDAPTPSDRALNEPKPSKDGSMGLYEAVQNPASQTTRADEEFGSF